MASNILWCFLIVFLMPGVLGGQKLPVNPQEANFDQWFNTATGKKNLPLMYGEVYSMIPKANSSHQFLSSKFFAPGTIRTTHQLYTELPLAFDLEKELLIIKHPDSSRFEGIVINMEQVVAFEVHDHHFKHLQNASGFYDVLYQGDSLSLVVKRSKERKAQTHGVFFEQTDRYFLYYRKRLAPIKNVRSYKRLFPSDFDDLKKMHRNVKIRYSPKYESQMVTFAAHLHQLIF